MADKSVEYYQQQLRKAQGNATFAENNGDTNQKNIFGAKLEAAKLDLARAEAAAAGSPPSNSVSTSSSPVAREAQTPANTAGNQTVRQSQAGQVNISSGPIYNDFGGGVTPISEMSDAERTEHIRANESLERSAYLDSRENGTQYVPGEATGNPAFGFTPPDPPPSAVEPDPPLPTGYGGGRGSVVEQPGERAAASTTGYSTPAEPASVPYPEQRTSATPVGETRETVLGGYDTEAAAEARTTRLIEREQSEAAAQGRPPDTYETVQAPDGTYDVVKVTEGEATPADTGFSGGRGSVVERPGERAAAAVPDTPEDTGYSDPFAEGGDVQDIGEETIIRSPEDSNLADDPIVNEYDEFGDIEERDLSAPPEPQEDAPTEDPVVNDYDEFAGIERDLQNPDSVVAADVDPAVDPTVANTAANEDINIANNQDAERRAAEQEADRQQQINQAALDKLKAQSAAQQNRDPQGTGDWRVKLRLASDSEYFYNADWQVDGNAGILRPLQDTDGIVFPYTPSIQILYAADYNQYHPTHSNYQHYFYKGSKVGEVVMTATFTAQDTAEANYLLAVIHFLKSASKMFYGQDPQRGSPPPLLFLTGLGEYQFNEAPCVISQFNYVLPNDVDYIRANVQQIRAGTLQYDLRNKNTGAALTSWSSSINRVLTTPGLTIGAENPTSRISSQTANLSTENATYVPTKMEMTITLLPVQNRLQVSEGFSLKEYANGDLIKGGFW